MDDLLIVRMSDRSKARYTARHKPTPLGANLGIIVGAGFGFLVANSYFPESPGAPMFGMFIGLGLGVAMGGLFGRFLKPSLSRRRAPRPDLYDGLPFSDEETEEEAEENEAT